jgi:two-component system NtrC family sensor kinase
VTSPTRFAFVLALVYAVAASLWIVASDAAVMLIQSGTLSVSRIQTGKGLLFVAATSVGLFLLMRSQMKRLKAMQTHTERVESLRIVGETAAAIAHDFRNLLMACRTHAEVARRASAEERVRRAAEQIIAATRRGEQITSEILAFAEPKELSPERIVLRDFLKSIADDVRPVVSGDIVVHCSVTPPELAVNADPGLLHRAILNVATNAKEAIAGSGSIVFEARPVANTPEVPGTSTKYVEVAVSDTGAGIPPELLNRIFEPRMTTKRSGTGLGLAIVHRIVSDHGGYVFATSRPGAGTTMHILLPRA